MVLEFVMPDDLRSTTPGSKAIQPAISVSHLPQPLRPDHHPLTGQSTLHPPSINQAPLLNSPNTFSISH